MKKKLLFANVIYYVFTFLVGILLAIFLPYFMMMYGESINTIAKSLDEGEYAKAYEMVGGYFDDEYVLLQDFQSGGGIVLFSAATLVPGQNKDGEEVQDMVLHKAYGGFIYGLKDTYNVSKIDDNKTVIRITDLNEVVHEVAILDSDTNGDQKPDTVGTWSKKGFVYVDFDQDTLTSVSKIELIDCDGNVYATVNTNLDYSQRFFTDVSDFIAEYNADFKSDKLEGLHKDFIAKSEHYKNSSLGVAKSTADKKSAIIVVCYFIGIYLIGDSLIGGRYVIKFFKWILVKVFKVKFKEKKPKYNEVFGHDYFCKFTLIADVSDVEDFDGSVQVRYSNEKGEAQFTLLKNRNYADTEQIKAGDYVNLWVDLDQKYITQGLPDTLEVEGYQKQITFKILKRED